MPIKPLLAACAACLVLAACDGINTDAERALAGGAVGAVTADVTGNNVATGAIAGAAAGALCDDLGVCD
ncbi:MAG: hypothetical protein ACU0CI_04185 [Shimia sp.]